MKLTITPTNISELNGKGFGLARKITTINQVIGLANKRGSVYDTRRHKHIPAAWMQNYPARLLQQYISLGILYVYKPKKK